MGCKGTTRLAPVDQLDQPPSIRLQHHRVSRGDTLYSIAWRYGMDYREIARLNQIRSPYTIYVGQKLDLGESPRASIHNMEQVIPVSEGAYAVQDSGGVREVSGVQEIKTAPPAVRQERVAESVKSAVPQESRTETLATEGSSRWVWPAQGPVIGRFVSGNPRQKGIDIGGSVGDPVLAASGGNVVYAGSGLKGYGQLVIIKHNEQYLSAYAHNSRLLVAEGAQVQQGQRIADMGASETDKTKLHFEIRQAGKPVDPLKYLPTR